MQLGELVEQVQQVTGGSIKVVFADQGYTGDDPKQQAAAHGVPLHVVKYSEAKKSFVLLTHRWVVERSLTWAARFCRLARDPESLTTSLTGLHWLAFGTLILESLSRQSQ